MRLKLGTAFLGALLSCVTGLAKGEPSLFYISTVGSDHYVAHDIDFHFALPRNFYITPNYNTYRSDLSDGQFHTYGGEFGRSVSGGSWRIYGSHTPEVSQYGQSTVAGELTQRILGNREMNPSKPELIARIRYSRRMHLEVFPTDTGEDRLHIQQNDYLGGLIARWRGTSLSGSYLKSAYDQNITVLRTATDVYQPVPGVSSVLGGYTDYARTLNISQRVAANWRVWTIWTHLRLKADDSIVNSYILGGGFYGKYLSCLLNYNIYRRSQEPTRNFVSLGLGWEFNPA